MATFRFGSSCSSSGIASVPEQHYDVLEHGEEDAADPNRLLQCPYDKSHQIRASRFPYHIIKCRKNHPKLASELKTCPFNAKHLIAPHEFSHHIANCVNKQAVNADNSGSAEMPRKWHVPVSTWTNPDNGEDWEKESEEMPETPFIWGVSNCQTDRGHFQLNQTSQWVSVFRRPCRGRCRQFCGPPVHLRGEAK